MSSAFKMVTINGVEYPAKKCKRCGYLKPINLFRKDRTSKDGRDTQCIRCRQKTTYV